MLTACHCRVLRWDITHGSDPPASEMLATQILLLLRSWNILSGKQKINQKSQPPVLTWRGGGGKRAKWRYRKQASGLTLWDCKKAGGNPRFLGTFRERCPRPSSLIPGVAKLKPQGGPKALGTLGEPAFYLPCR